MIVIVKQRGNHHHLWLPQRTAVLEVVGIVVMRDDSAQVIVWKWYHQLMGIIEINNSIAGAKEYRQTV